MRRRFGVAAAGNAPSDPHGEFTGKNILYAAMSPEDVAKATGRPTEGPPSPPVAFSGQAGPDPRPCPNVEGLPAPPDAVIPL